MASTSQASVKRELSEIPVPPSKRFCNENLTRNEDMDHEPSQNIEINDVEHSMSSIKGRRDIMEKVKKRKYWKFMNVLIDKGVKLDIRDEITGETLSDVAYHQNEFDILSKIITADGPFPTTEENGKRISVKEKVLKDKSASLKATLETRIEFHENIKKNNIEAVKKFVADHPNLKHAYRGEQWSALTTAIKYKRFSLYSWLRSKGFEPGSDARFETVFLKLPDAELELIRDFNRENFSKPDKIYIYRLVSKSRPAYGSECSDFEERVKNYYEELDTEEFRPILKLVSESNKTEIVFDFNSDNVHDIDPSASKTDCGTTYPYGYILIGARRNTLQELLGTLIHELLHFSNQLVYENCCLPYYQGNVAEESKLLNIVQIYDNDEMKSKSSVVALALKKEFDWRKKIGELIVRPAQLTALLKDQPGQLQQLKVVYKDLFSYYENKTLVDIASAIEYSQKQTDIKRFNLELGFFEKYYASKVYCRNLENNFEQLDGNVILRSKTPKLVATNFLRYQSDNLKKLDSKCILLHLASKYMFTDLQTFEDRRFEARFKDIFGWERRPTLVVVVAESNEFDAEKLSSISKKFGSQTNFIVIANNDNPISSRNHIINYNWSDLEESSKDALLTRAFKLNNHDIKLCFFVSKNSEEIMEKPLENVLNLVENTLDTKLPSHLPSYINRKFKVMSKGRQKILYAGNLADLVSKKQPVILADVAGMGKSTSAVEIATLLKDKTTNWIAFIDLKNHTGEFKKDQEDHNCSFDAKFFSEKILKLNSSPEMKFLFELMYKARVKGEHKKTQSQGQEKEGSVTFIIDGFDEISPNYKKFVLALLTAIKESGNRLLINTRVHLRSDLEDHLGVTAFKLMPLDENDRIDLIANCWASDETRITSRLKPAAKKVLEAIQLSLKSKKKRSDYSEFFGIPMHVYMLAAQSSKDVENFNFNAYDLYHKFVCEKLKNCENNGGPLAENDRDNLASFNKFEVYYKAALAYFFDKKIVDALNFPCNVTPLCEERILSQGLLRNKDGKPEFLHMSYAEFFVADFVLNYRRIASEIAVINEIILKIFCSEKYENIRKFLNECLYQNHQNHKNLQICKKSLKKFLNDKVNCKLHGMKHRRLLYFTVDENHTELLKFILDCLGCPTKKKIEILTNKFKNDRTIHRSIKESGTDMFDVLFDWLGTELEEEDLDKILTCEGKYGDNISDRAGIRKNKELVRKIQGVRALNQISRAPRLQPWAQFRFSRAPNFRFS